MVAPVTGRVRSFEEAERLLRNHHERLVQLEERARAAGRRWRVWPGSALQPLAETDDISRTAFAYTMNAASGRGILPFDHDRSERVVEVHGAVDPAAAASITMSLRGRAGGSATAPTLSPDVVSVGTEIQLLSITDLLAYPDDPIDAMCVFFDCTTAGDRVNTVVVVTEPVP